MSVYPTRQSCDFHGLDCNSFRTHNDCQYECFFVAPFVAMVAFDCLSSHCMNEILAFKRLSLILYQCMQLLFHIWFPFVMVWHGAESYVDCHFLSSSNNVPACCNNLNRSAGFGTDLLCYDQYIQIFMCIRCFIICYWNLCIVGFYLVIFWVS